MDKIKDNNLVRNSLLYGFGIFETFKVEEKIPLYYREHMERLKKGMEILGMKEVEEDLKKKVESYLEEKNLIEGVLRVTIVKDLDGESHFLLTNRENQYTRKDYMEGFNLTLSKYKRNENSILTYIKSTNYLENLLILTEERKKGFNEVVFFNSKEKLSEGATSNIFLIKGKKIITPDIKSGLLEGIIREKVIEVLKESEFYLEVRPIEKDELEKSCGIFLTNSVMEIMPVKSIEGIDYFLESSGLKIINKLQKKLDEKNKNTKEEWRGL